MSTSTTNLALTKPAIGEAADITVLNTNMDLLDTAVGARSNLVSTVTVANTTTETVVFTHTIGAGTAAVGNAFRAVALGQASTTGTPTLTVRARIGGVAGQVVGSIVITTASGISNKNLRLEAEMLCKTTGASATWLGGITTVNELTATLPGCAVPNVITAAVTKDSTVQQTFVITVQWGTASASNTVSFYSGYGHRAA